MIDSVKQNIIQLDYGWNAQSLVVFIPGISLLVQKIKSAHIYANLKETYTSGKQLTLLLASKEYAQLDKMHKWHSLGSLVQTIVFVTLGIMCNPLFFVPSVFSLYEMHISSKGLTHKFVLHEDNKLEIQR